MTESQIETDLKIDKFVAEDNKALFNDLPAGFLQRYAFAPPALEQGSQAAVPSPAVDRVQP